MKQNARWDIMPRLILAKAKATKGLPFSLYVKNSLQEIFLGRFNISREQHRSRNRERHHSRSRSRHRSRRSRSGSKERRREEEVEAEGVKIQIKKQEQKSAPNHQVERVLSERSTRITIKITIKITINISKREEQPLWIQVTTSVSSKQHQ